MALTKYNYNSFNVTPAAGAALGFNSGANGLTTATGGSMVLIKTLTASTSDTLDFVDGTDDVVLDNTYPTYKFEYIGIHPGTDSKHLQFQGNVAGGSGYNETMTTTHFRAVQAGADNDRYLHYHNDPTDLHQAQGTAFQTIASYFGSDNDQNGSGILYLFNPSSTTFVKHFMSEATISNPNDYHQHNFVAGYFNTTSAIDEIQFKMNSGNIDAGTIKLYGIKDS